mgnify:CR=1 FL=1
MASEARAAPQDDGTLDSIVDALVASLLAAGYPTWDGKRAMKLRRMLAAVPPQLRDEGEVPEESRHHHHHDGSSEASCHDVGSSTVCGGDAAPTMTDEDAADEQRNDFFEKMKNCLRPIVDRRRAIPAQRASATSATAGSACQATKHDGCGGGAATAATIVSALPDETLHMPKDSALFDAEVPTFEVDSFLYDDDEIDDVLGVPREYCLACGALDQSRPTQYISHSFSAPQLTFLAKYLLPLCVGDAEPGAPPCLVDVGSRLGIVVAALARELQSLCRTQPLLRGARVEGIEINKDFVDIQRQLLKALRLDGGAAENIKVQREAPPIACHIQLLDALSDDGIKLMTSATLTVLNNVFELFLPTAAEQLAAFNRVREGYTAASGASAAARRPRFILAFPSLEVTMAPLFRSAGGLKRKAPRRDEEKERSGSGEAAGDVSGERQRGKAGRGRNVQTAAAVSHAVKAWIDSWLTEVDTSTALEACLLRLGGVGGRHEPGGRCNDAAHSQHGSSDGSCSSHTADDESATRELLSGMRLYAVRS